MALFVLYLLTINPYTTMKSLIIKKALFLILFLAFLVFLSSCGSVTGGGKSGREGIYNVRLLDGNYPASVSASSGTQLFSGDTIWCYSTVSYSDKVGFNMTRVNMTGTSYNPNVYVSTADTIGTNVLPAIVYYRAVVR